jgi:hypothetical protein
VAARFHFSLQTRKSKRREVNSTGSKFGQHFSPIGDIDLQFSRGVSPYSSPHTADGNIQQPEKNISMLNITGCGSVAGQYLILEIGTDKESMALRVKVREKTIEISSQ